VGPLDRGVGVEHSEEGVGVERMALGDDGDPDRTVTGGV
jgi:hypothetical protein